MSKEKKVDRTLIIDTPEGIEAFRMAAVITALRIEVTTGMKSRFSPLQVAKQAWGCPKGTKAGALKWLEAHYAETYGEALKPL